MPVQKKTKKSKRLKGLDFALSLVVFKWHRGSEGVNLASSEALSAEL